MLCEDLAHATEQLNMLTEASKKHSGLLQSAQEELTRKDALIQELQHEVRCRVIVAQDGLWGLGEHDCVAVELMRSLPRLILYIQKGGLAGWVGSGAAALSTLNNLVASVCSDLVAVLLPTLCPWHVPASSNHCGKGYAWLFFFFF